MMLAWFSSSEMIASEESVTASKKPPFASKHELYRMVASVPRNADSRRSSSMWSSVVPQMNRTEAIPKPHSSSPLRAASMTAGWSASPR